MLVRKGSLDVNKMLLVMMVDTRCWKLPTSREQHLCPDEVYQDFHHSFLWPSGSFEIHLSQYALPSPNPVSPWGTDGDLEPWEEESALACNPR